jgi:hypothetical protein
MSLKTDFFDGASGLQTQMDNAFTAGSAFVTASLTTLSAALIANAAQGLTKFTVSIASNDNPVALRGNKGHNLYLKSYLAGVQAGLAAQQVYNYECHLELNVSDTVTTSIDFNFNFRD